jgi:hypothetical protein
VIGMKDEDIIAEIFQTRNTNVYFFEHMLKCMELARADERAKVAEEIFKWLDNQLYFQTGDGEYEDFVREYAELKERFLGKQKPEGKKEGD